MDRQSFIQFISRTDISQDELSIWFKTVRDYLEASYLETQTPWQQSGKSGSYEDWVRLRIPMAELIQKSGSVLDIGCANGYLLLCLLEWTAHKKIQIVPYGLDISAALVEHARQHLPAFKDHLFHGNAWDWIPPVKFDFVRTELVYVPVSFQRDYLARLLRDVVAPNGLLIVAHYRSQREDLTMGWIDEQLSQWGYTAHAIARGFNSSGLELSRFIALSN